MVFSHNDLQENNLLQTQYGLRMIDFESVNPLCVCLMLVRYSYFNYQSADLANFFCEFTLDYVRHSRSACITASAGFPEALSLLHGEQICLPHSGGAKVVLCSVISWLGVCCSCSCRYLSEYLETPVFPSDDAYILPLLRNIERYLIRNSVSEPW